jgi:hypothetical protein
LRFFAGAVAESDKAGLRQIYTACYGGTISVFRRDDPNHDRRIEDVRVRHAVHILALDLETDRV